MATLILVRHGRTAANAKGVLAGRSKGVLLDDVGREQTARLAERLANVPLRLVVTSPLERTVATAAAIAAAQTPPAQVRRDKAFVECGYGAWTGEPLSKLAKDPLWKTVQQQPSAARFPDGESMAEMSQRAVAAARRWDAAVTEEHGPDAIWAAASHGDVIKAVVADALGLHLDQFQRITVAPGSVSVVRYTEQRPYVLHVNDGGSDLAGLVAPKRKRGRRTNDAVVGGGA